METVVSSLADVGLNREGSKDRGVGNLLTKAFRGRGTPDKNWGQRPSLSRQCGEKHNHSFVERADLYQRK